MKKIILIISIFFLTGCYDYKEVNNLSFISAIAVDYYDDKFQISFEILSDSNEKSTFKVSASGNNISESFDNISLKISKIPYYYHLKAIIISKEIAKNHMQEFTDFIVRNTEIRNEFYLFISDDTPPSAILDLTDDEEKVIGEKLSKIILSNKYNYNVSYDKPFEDVLEKLLNPNVDAVCATVSSNNNKLEIKGLSIFKDFTYKYTLDNEKSSLIKLLSQKSFNILLNYNDTSIKIYNSNVTYKINKNNVKIMIDASAIITQSKNYDLKKEETYKELNKVFSNILTEKTNKLFATLKENNLDPLGIKNMYYQKNKDIPLNINIDIESNIRINKKGLIFEVTNE